VLIQRLTAQELIDRTYLLEENVQVLNEQVELEKAMDQKAAAAKKLALYMAGGN
jgi:hypothetical protein